MQKLQNETLEKSLREYYENGSLKLYFDPEQKIGFCEVIAPYIPMDEFMDGFNNATEMIKQNGLKTFVFDKRSLRTFHQPSMEWYFVQWKPMVRDLGLKQHYKILPPEKWFQKCVQAGKQDITDNYPDNLLEGIQITYVNNVADALESSGKDTIPA